MIRGRSNSSTLLTSGVVARLVMFVLGITCVVLFQLWGLSGYLIAVVIYCRVMSSRRGINIHSYPMKWRSGNVRVAYFSIFSILFILISVMWFTWKSPEVVAKFFDLANNVKLLSGLPNCVNPSYFTGIEFYSCQSLNSGVAVVAFLAPIGVAVFLNSLILFSQIRIGVSKKFLLILFGVTLFVCLTPLLLPVGIQNTLTYFVIDLIFALLFLQLFLAYFWLRISSA